MTVHKMHNRFKSANGWQVEKCPEGHTEVLLFDDKERLFAEAHIGDTTDVNHFILALIMAGEDACKECITERLEEIVSEVRGDLASAQTAA